MAQSKEYTKIQAMLNSVQLFLLISRRLASGFAQVPQIASICLFNQQVAAASNLSERESSIVVYHIPIPPVGP